MNFVDINIKKFAGIEFTNAITETLYSLHSVLFCRVNFLVLLFCNFCSFHKRRHRFLRTKKYIWKQLKAKTIIAISIIVIVIDIFIIISRFYNRAELTDLHERHWFFLSFAF